MITIIIILFQLTTYYALIYFDIAALDYVVCDVFFPISIILFVYLIVICISVDPSGTGELDPPIIYWGTGMGSSPQ